MEAFTEKSIVDIDMDLTRFGWLAFQTLKWHFIFSVMLALYMPTEHCISEFKVAFFSLSVALASVYAG